MPNAGNAQLAGTWVLLKEAGCTLWDFGMAMDYKVPAPVQLTDVVTTPPTPLSWI